MKLATLESMTIIPHIILYLSFCMSSLMLFTNRFDGLENYLSSLGYPNHEIHTGPLISREPPYKELLMEDRKKLFNLLFRFARKLPIRFMTAKVRKAECSNTDELETKLTKAITNEISRNEDYFKSFDKLIIYYDSGQKSLK
ncbi:MAG: hypothetical protein K6C41_07385 [Lachnospiraceae bacterium]|nr:hypothetical protein [Lachnospiraceae bacterium]